MGDEERGASWKSNLRSNPRKLCGWDQPSVIPTATRHTEIGYRGGHAFRLLGLLSSHVVDAFLKLVLEAMEGMGYRLTLLEMAVIIFLFQIDMHLLLLCLFFFRTQYYFAISAPYTFVHLVLT